MKKRILLLTLLGALQSALAAETTLGQAYEIAGLEIGGVYLQPVSMEPMMKDDMPSPADIHLELDIHALKNNPYGFKADDWIPYLNVTYHLEEIDTHSRPYWSQTGTLMPMEANDGPHYGRNIRLGGTGHYKVTYHIDSPDKNGFLRHTDKETGIAPWFKPIDVSWDFFYFGTGKKGGY